MFSSESQTSLRVSEADSRVQYTFADSVKQSRPLDSPASVPLASPARDIMKLSSQATGELDKHTPIGNREVHYGRTQDRVFRVASRQEESHRAPLRRPKRNGPESVQLRLVCAEDSGSFGQ